MHRTRRTLAALTVAGAVLVGGATLAVAADRGGVEQEGPRDDDAGDTAITGDALARASQVAVDHVGGGTVTGTEVDDEESWYEVEVTRPDGRRVDVQLDRDLRVVGAEGDGTGD